MVWMLVVFCLLITTVSCDHTKEWANMAALGGHSVSVPINTSTMKKQVVQIFRNINLTKVVYDFSNSSHTPNTSRNCLNGFKLKDLSTYIDADGKPESGLLLGNLYWLGSYKECMSQRKAHYCTIAKIFVPKLKFFITVGLCVPDACDLEDVLTVLSFVGNTTKLFVVQNNPALTESSGSDAVCYSTDKEYDCGAIVMICLSAIILFLCVLGSVIEVVSTLIKQRKSNPYTLHDSTVEKCEADNLLVKTLLCFSIIQNTRKLFDTNVPPGAITSVNGVRTLSIMWVILGHVLIFALPTTGNTLTIYSWLPRFTMQAIENATLAVDSFFLLSGLLVGYLSIKRIESKGLTFRFLLRYYVHRYIRLTPSYAYCIFFLAYIYPVSSEGPFWFMQNLQSKQSQDCVKYWWTNLLYINNLYPKTQNMCLNWSWYLANDMQFYIISPVILFCMYKFKWIGVAVANGSLLLFCFLMNGFWMHKYHASPLFYEKSTGVPTQKSPVAQYMAYLYMKPYIRLSPYFVGLVLGYILAYKHVFERKKYLLFTLGWLIAIGLGLSVVYGPYSVNDYTWKEVDNIIYGVMFRFVWAIALGWVVYACHNGFGGLVNDLMSWRAFIPLSRLTYATYLVHPMVIFLFYYSSQVAINFTILNYVFFFVGVTTISFAAAYVLSICIDEIETMISSN